MGEYTPQGVASCQATTKGRGSGGGDGVVGLAYRIGHIAKGPWDTLAKLFHQQPILGCAEVDNGSIA